MTLTPLVVVALSVAIAALEFRAYLRRRRARGPSIVTPGLLRAISCPRCRGRLGEHEWGCGR